MTLKACMTDEELKPLISDWLTAQAQNKLMSREEPEKETDLEARMD